jgi:protein kinase A
MLQGVSYMHDRHVIHRDLKPENVLLNSRGYTVLVDLGFARVVVDKTHTFCGSPIYVAPEVILQKGEPVCVPFMYQTSFLTSFVSLFQCITGYDKSADIWSWAVMLYEMIVGISPFYEPGMRKMALFKRIVSGKYSFPCDDDFMSSESKHILRQLLVPDPKDRLGCFPGSHQDICIHPWFKTVDFDSIEKMEADAPWVPKAKDPLDATSFDNWDHLQEEEDEKKPLSKQEQHLFDDF